MNLTQMKKISNQVSIKAAATKHNYEFVLNNVTHDKNSPLYNGLCYIKLLPLLKTFDSKSDKPHKNFVADFDNFVIKIAQEEKHLTIWKITDAFNTPVTNDKLPTDLLALLVRRAASFVLHGIKLHLDSNYDIVPEVRKSLPREECYSAIIKELEKNLQEK